MSERVLPTEPGFWWYRWKKIGPVVGYVDWFGQLCLYDRKNQTPVSDCEFEWLEPVAPLGTAARLAAAEAELADLKQRIAASPVAWVQFGNHNNPCEISEDRETFWDGEHPPGTLQKCRLLEVRDGE